MSYKRFLNGRVLIDMTAEDFDWLVFLLGNRAAGGCLKEALRTYRAITGTDAPAEMPRPDQPCDLCATQAGLNFCSYCGRKLEA